jgi:hypothetical protein
MKSLSPQLNDKLLNGGVLALDPASGGTSLPGWAYALAGEEKASGVLEIYGGGIQHRLRKLALLVQELTKDLQVDVLCVEMLPRRVHHYVMWSVGAFLGALRGEVEVLEVPIKDWKETVRENSTYSKGDEQDARAILATALLAPKRGRARAGVPKREPKRPTHVRKRPTGAVRVRSSGSKRPGRVGRKRKRRSGKRS